MKGCVYLYKADDQNTERLRTAKKMFDTTQTSEHIYVVPFYLVSYGK